MCVRSLGRGVSTPLGDNLALWAQCLMQMKRVECVLLVGLFGPTLRASEGCGASCVCAFLWCARVGFVSGFPRQQRDGAPDECTQPARKTSTTKCVETELCGTTTSQVSLGAICVAAV